MQSIEIYYDNDWRRAERFAAFGDEWYGVLTPAAAMVAARVADIPSSKVRVAPSAAEPGEGERDAEGHKPTPHEPVKGLTIHAVGMMEFRAGEETKIGHLFVDGEWAGWLYGSGRIATTPPPAIMPDTSCPGVHHPVSPLMVEKLRTFRDSVRVSRAPAPPAPADPARVDHSRITTPKGRAVTFKNVDSDPDPDCIGICGDKVFWVHVDGIGNKSFDEPSWVPNRWPLPPGTAERIDAYLDGLDAERGKAEQPKPYTLATWPAEATRVRGKLWPAGEWAAIAWVQEGGVGTRCDTRRPRTMLTTWQEMVTFNWQWSSDGREWHPCVLSPVAP